MFGNIGEIVGLLSDKKKLATRIKQEVPPLVRQLTTVIAEQCGAEGRPTAVVLFPYAKPDGSTSTMARVHLVTPFGDLGEDLGTIDLDSALASIPDEAITKLLPL